MSDEKTDTSALREYARDPETRMAARRIASAVLDLVASALRLIPVPVLRSVAADAFASWVRPVVLRELDELLGGDGDPTDEVGQASPTPAEAVERVGSIPAPVTQAPPAAHAGPHLQNAGPAIRNAGLLLRRPAPAK